MRVVCFCLLVLLHQNVVAGCTFHNLVGIILKETKDVMNMFVSMSAISQKMHDRSSCTICITFVSIQTTLKSNVLDK